MVVGFLLVRRRFVWYNQLMASDGKRTSDGGRDIKACIFDFDGVIVDSEKYHHLAWQWLAKELGVEFSYEEYRPFQSGGRQKVIPYLFAKAGKTLTAQDMALYSQRREECARAALGRLSPKDIVPGVVDFVRNLRKDGVKCAVASASSSSHIVAQRLGLLGLFDVFVDGEAHLPHKPDPAIFLHVAALLGVLPQQCVVFEDSQNGILAATNAQMAVVGVRSHFTTLVPVIDDFENLSLQRIQQLWTNKC